MAGEKILDLFNRSWSQEMYFKMILGQRIHAKLGNERGLRLLDIGCGSKPYESLFDDIVIEYVGIDVEAGRTVNAVYDGKIIPFKDEQFDIVLCSAVLEHAENPQEVVNEARRVLKTGGVAIFTAPFQYQVHSAPADYWRFTGHGLKRLFAEYHNVEVHGMDNAFLRAFWWIPQTFSAVLYKTFKFITKSKDSKVTSFPEHGDNANTVGQNKFMKWALFILYNNPFWLWLNLKSIPFMLISPDSGEANYSRVINNIVIAKK